MTRGGALLLMGMVAVVVAACPGSPAEPELSDPREVVGRTIVATSALQTMQIRVDLEVRTPDGRLDGGSAEGALDLAAGEARIAAWARDGSQRFDAILADGSLFAQNGGGERWTRVPMANMDPMSILGGGMNLGGSPDYATVLAATAADARTVMELRGVEDCPAGRCYRTIITIQPQQVWQVMIALVGLDRLPGNARPDEPPPDQLPTIRIELLTDTSSLRLVDLVGSATVGDQGSVSVRFQVAAPDEPVVIGPPPPALVDDSGFGF